MKRFFVVICILIIYFVHSTIFVFAQNNNFARIEKTTELFKTNSDNNKIDNIFCLAEESYFVEIISDYDKFYKVIYNGITGYIKKTDVKEITNQPITPYPYNIKLILNNNCNLRLTPTTNANINNIVSIVYKDNSNIDFIGRTIGEEAIDFGGNTWYFVCCNGNYGYIYNNYVKSITPIYKNTETFSYKETINNQLNNPLTNIPSLIIIIILSIPILFVLLLLYIPNKHKTQLKKPKSNKEIERY